MTYYGAKELAASFRTVRGNTIQIAEEIPEEHYGFRTSPEVRSIADTLVHIALGTRLAEQIQFAEPLGSLNGFDFFAFMGKQSAEEKKNRSKAEIVALLRAEGDKFAGRLENVTEEFLAEQVEMPHGATPATKSRFEMLLSPKEHEMHHRGQLMLMERMIGIVPHVTRKSQERMAQMQAAAAR